MEGSGWLWLFIDVVLVAILGLGLAYGVMMWRRRRLDRNGRDETRYLRPIQEIISRDITPADELLEKFRGPWGGSVAPVFEEYAY